MGVYILTLCLVLLVRTGGPYVEPEIKSRQVAYMKSALSPIFFQTPCIYIFMQFCRREWLGREREVPYRITSGIIARP